ncbi:MAG: outer membrane beta-barrel protein [Tunicatimonas sp.]
MLKFVFIAITVSVGLWSRVVAQSFQAQAVVGLNAAQIDGDGLWGYNQAGILGGVKVALPLSDAISAQAGMLYSAKGSRSSEYEPFAIWRLTYLELPIEIQGRVVDQVYLFGGLSPNYLIRARQENTTGVRTDRRGYRSFDLCYVAGVLYRFADNAGVQARISDGLRSSSQVQYIRNRTLGFALVYYFSEK